MINMKCSKQSYPEISKSPESPSYPYGLQINLDTESLKKLGIEDLPEIGTVMSLSAKVVVQSTSEHESLLGGDSNHMCLQITDMEIGKKTSATAKKLYGDKE